MLPPTFRRLAIAILLALGIIPLSTPPASAADTILLETGLEWCQGCYDGWTVSSGATQWIAFVVTASGAATVSKVELNLNNTNASSLAGTTVEFYGNPTVAPKNSADLLGTLTFSEFRLQPSQTTSGAAVFTGSVSVPAAGQYWFKFGNLAPTKSARYRFGSISYASGTWSPYQGTPNDDFFDGGVQQNLNYYPAMRITGTAGGGGGGGGGSSQTAEEIAAEARENQARKLTTAKNEIRSTLSSHGELTVQQLLKADVSGVNSRNIKFINDDLSKLGTEAAKDMSAVERIFNRYAVLEKVISRQRISFNELAQMGLANASSPFRSVILRELSFVSSELMSTPDRLAEAIAEIEKKAAARKAYVKEQIAKHYSK